ncbi:type I restriction endonuclease subunit R, EcoR124 family [Empedobacter tilapiae]
MRSKRELIEKFIQESLPNIEDSDSILEKFKKFWNIEQEKAMQELVSDENLHFEKTASQVS